LTRARCTGSLAILALLLACGEDRVTPLREEIAKLKKERVSSEQLETGKREADEAEKTRDAAVAQADADESAVAAQRAELDRQRAALRREVDRNAELRAAIDAREQPLADVSSGVNELEIRANERRRYLGVLRDQAKALARALTPEDPAWAEKRRLSAVADFDRALAEQLPAEPEVRDLGRELRAVPPDKTALVAALQSVAALLDRRAGEAAPPAAAPAKK
jgi:chromosome segregation ATPase